MPEIKMVDLAAMHEQMQPELTAAMEQVIRETDFIQGTAVKQFLLQIANYLSVHFAIGCGNGTDALMLAIMALDLPKGAEIIIPAFNYVAAAEAVALLGFQPVFADADPLTFNLDPDAVKSKITSRTGAIVAVHLFGSCAGLNQITALATGVGIPLIEDNAQSLGAQVKTPDGKWVFAGTVGQMGTTSFFPTKMLGAMGDGGALFTRDATLAGRLRLLANHGQDRKYHFSRVGINSRLDSLQAAVLKVKLNYLGSQIERRREVAQWYREMLKTLPQIILPLVPPDVRHVYNQYTIQVPAASREALKQFLETKGIATGVYYHLPLHLQPAYQFTGNQAGEFPVAENLCRQVLSLPMHPLMTREQVNWVGTQIKAFFA